MRVVIGVKRFRARKGVNLGDYICRKVQAQEHRFFRDGLNNVLDVRIGK
jgi:hypothetical protein